MTVLLIIAALVFFGGVLATTLPYWYELPNSPCEDIPAAPYGAKSVLKLWANGSWTAILLLLAHGLDPLMRYLEKREKDTEPDTLPPVLLVHGLYHNPTGWVYLRRHLRRAGFRKIHTMGYSSWRTDLEAVTSRLNCAINTMENRYPGQKPILVGHSLGGLMIRKWLADADNQKRALGALTLGAPHRGSKMAALALGSLGKSLLPSNPFFNELARTENPAAIPCVSMVSEADTMVLPLGNLVPETKGWAMRVTPYATHAGTMTRAAVLRMATWELHRMARETRNESGTAEEAVFAEPAPVQAEPARTQAEPTPVETVQVLAVPVEAPAASIQVFPAPAVTPGGTSADSDSDSADYGETPAKPDETLADSDGSPTDPARTADHGDPGPAAPETAPNNGASGEKAAPAQVFPRPSLVEETRPTAPAVPASGQGNAQDQRPGGAKNKKKRSGSKR